MVSFAVVFFLLHRMHTADHSIKTITHRGTTQEAIHAESIHSQFYLLDLHFYSCVTLHSLISQALRTDSKSDKSLKTMQQIYPRHIFFLYIQLICQICYSWGISAISMCHPKGSMDNVKAVYFVKIAMTTRFHTGWFHIYRVLHVQSKWVLSLIQFVHCKEAPFKCYD